MVIFPNCKINLGLRITGKRNDGYHDLDTVFYPVPLYEALEIVEGSGSNKTFEMHMSGLKVAGSEIDNLCYKAWKLICADYPQIPTLRMFLHKTIPLGAGLGGGSADGAFTLKLLNDLLHLNISQEQLLNYALQLGSDCPFFILNKPCRAKGRGEQMAEIAIDLKEYYFILVNPGIHISTGETFRDLNEMKDLENQPQTETDIRLFFNPVETWKDWLLNDFELPVFRKYPELHQLKQELYDAGASYASMTGTGSCIYGIFKKTLPVPQLQPGGRYAVYHLNPEH